MTKLAMLGTFSLLMIEIFKLRMEGLIKNYFHRTKSVSVQLNLINARIMHFKSEFVLLVVAENLSGPIVRSCF